MAATLPPATGNGLPIMLNGASTTLDVMLGSGPVGQKLPRLTKWRNALALMRRGNRDAVLLCAGDSTTRGSGSVGATFATWAHNGYPAQLATMLAASGLPVIDQNVCAAGAFGNSADPRLTFGGGWNGTTSAGTLGGNAFTTTAAGTLSFTTTSAVDTFDVYYIDITGVMSLNIDGGSGTTVTGGNTFGPKMVTVTAGAVATHTLNAVWTSGQPYVIAIVGRNSSSKSILPINAGVHGSASSYHAGSGSFSPISTLAKVKPDLTIFSIGINDIGGLVASSTTQTNMQTFITAAKTYGDVLLVAPPPLQVTGNYTVTAQKALNATYYTLTAADTSLSFLDMYQRWSGDWTAQNTIGWQYDNLHPNQYGYSDLASFVAPLVAAP